MHILHSTHPHIDIYTNDYDNINTTTATNDNSTHPHPHTTNDQHYSVISITTPKSKNDSKYGNAKLKGESKTVHTSQLQVTRYHWVENAEQVNFA